MLSIHQISKAVDDASNDRMSIEEFERWLRKGTLNFHAWADANLSSAILSVESVISEYRFGGMEEHLVKEELVEAIRPFQEQPKGELKRVDDSHTWLCTLDDRYQSVALTQPQKPLDSGEGMRSPLVPPPALFSDVSLRFPH